MAILYDILEKKQLNKYPPLPAWVLETLKAYEKVKDDDRYYEFTYSIRFDEIRKRWTRATND